MDLRSCGCCNRMFEVSQLKLHAVGGGVREANELLCADCWAIFASEPWDEAAAPAPLQLSSALQAPANEPNGAGAQQGRAQQAGAHDAGAHAEPASHQHRQAIDSRAESLGVVKRLSGGGAWQRPPAASRLQLSSRESLGSAGLQQPAADGDSIPGSRPGQDGPARLEGKGSGPVLKRGRSGRFVSAKPASPAAAAEDDPLMQDLLSSQAHLLQEPRQPRELASKASTSGGNGESASAQPPGLPGDLNASAMSAGELRAALERAAQERDAAAEQCAQLRSQVASLETCLRSARLLVLCTVCKSERRTAAALPCGHLLYCLACMDALRARSGSCGKCAGPIRGVQSVFF